MVVIDPLYDRYVEYYHPREWEVLAAEEYFEFPIDDKEEIILNFAIDLAIRQRGKGKYAGDVGIVDHKAVGNFLTNNELAMHTQLPKYIYAANQLGLFGGNIKFGILNQVRYKAPQKFDASKTFARVILEPSVARQENMIKEHLKTARHIVRKRKMPVTEVREEATKTLIKDICKWCDYRSPCDQELEGNDPSQTLAVFFKPRDYSYREGRVKRI
jgi:hypothetical protein